MSARASGLGARGEGEEKREKSCCGISTWRSGEELSGCQAGYAGNGDLWRQPQDPVWVMTILDPCTAALKVHAREGARVFSSRSVGSRATEN